MLKHVTERNFMEKNFKGWIVLGMLGQPLDGTFSMESHYQSQTLAWIRTSKSWHKLEKEGYTVTEATLSVKELVFDKFSN